jgi:predicted phosphodiesterase
MSSNALESVLIVPDTHVPYHDQRAWELVMKAAKWFKPERIIIQGDFPDFYAVSSHSKDPARKSNLEWEVGEVRKKLDELDNLGAKQKHWIAGNHDDRLTRYLQDKAPELFGLVGIPQLFELPSRGWTYTPYKDDRRFGRLYATHDVGTAGRYATYNALDTYQHSVITGHTHRLSYVVEGNAVGEFKLSASFGWLGDIGSIDYMHKAKAKKNWALGFGYGYLHRNTGIAYLCPAPIVKYTACVNGRLFEN